MKAFALILLCTFANSISQEPGAEKGAPSEEPKTCPPKPFFGAFAKIEKECREKENIKDEDMKTVHEIYRTGKIATEPSDAIKCFLTCTLVQQKKLTESGAANLECMQDNYAKAVEKLKECSQIKNEKPCESGYQMSTCLHEVRRLTMGF
ncbi:uncharacterized protein LOC116179674 [Photinus pyralis]|uniref:uncharacterized protein LOC116178207 n=1 Tax=Photinus pyralis TaxID=7054 RepID=UPI0012672EE6|nr:uncharacterized protein LOC116178207 [Photinus pyralis]XP_031355348.1 uncharacterized protein LOC116179674 [Photinus pyralis]